MKALLKAVLAVAVVSTLSGCATSPEYAAAEAYVKANTPIKGANKEQCDMAWQQTQYFIQKNAGMKLQIVTDTVIETYNGTPAKGEFVSPKMGTATKLPVMGGGCEIEAQVSQLVFGQNTMDAFVTRDMIKFVKSRSQIQ